MRNWPYAWTELQKPGSSVQGKVGMALMVADSGERPGATVGSWGLSLLKQSQHQEATVKAIRFLTSETAQRERFINQGYTPTSRSMFFDPELISLSSALPEIAQALDHSVLRPQTPIYAQLSDVLQRQLNGLLTSKPFTPEASGSNTMERTQQKSEMLLKATGAVP
jgi:multiple sugar transport system substrate-binding protein